MASGGRTPRSRTTRAAASRCSAGRTASRYGSPPRSGVAVEASKTVMAVTSGWLTLVGDIGPGPLLTRTAARGQERLECSPRTLRHRWGESGAVLGIPWLSYLASPSVLTSPCPWEDGLGRSGPSRLLKNSG